jgi:hypothetical protein
VTAWLVTGLDDPALVPVIAANVRRQVAAGVRLVLVENGAGIGWGSDLRLATLDPIVVQSAPGCAAYVNAGIAVVRERAAPGDVFLKFDGDDYYGAGYVAACLAVVRPGIGCAQPNIYVRTPANGLWSVTWPRVRYREVVRDGAGVCHGPTLGCTVGDLLDFPVPGDAWGEDGLWVRAMRMRGRRFAAVPRGHFAYVRRADRRHAFPLVDDRLRHIWPGAVVRDLGAWDPGVVDGQYQPRTCRLLPFDPRQMMSACESLLPAGCA